jgi:DNA topoisomerase I
VTQNSATRTAVRITRRTITRLHDDAEWAATAAGLRYVSPELPGIRRIKRGKGFSYLTADGSAITAVDRERIKALVIPPAWREVWICTDSHGHLQAVGEDDRGRKQYLYHQDWRTLRDLVNFYRLIGFGAHLTAIRSHVDSQLRRRTLDAEQVTAAMIRIVDRCGFRAGSEVYAEENESFGLSTLTRKHVSVHGTCTEFSFPAKSGQQALAVLDDPSVARVVRVLAARRARRLFTVDGAVLGADEVNDQLGRLTDDEVTLKDFRTWRGTTVAFGHLRAHLDASDPEAEVVAAIDAAAEALGNTRAVARAHYVHPHVVDAYLDGRLASFLSRFRGRSRQGLDRDEVALVAFLPKALTHWTDSVGR